MLVRAQTSPAQLALSPAGHPRLVRNEPDASELRTALCSSRMCEWYNYELFARRRFLREQHLIHAQVR
jgi:hypothetical protein